MLQGNILTTAVLIFLSKTQSPALILARGCVATYIVIVGIVYSILLVGLPIAIGAFGVGAWAISRVRILKP